MTESTSSVDGQQPAPGPDAELRSLDRLVGTWRVTGGASGQVTYRWLEGGFFLAQDFDLEQDGQQVKGLELIGRERSSAPSSPAATSSPGSTTARATPSATCMSRRVTP